MGLKEVQRLRGRGEGELPLFSVPFSGKSLAHAEVTKYRDATSKLETTIRREKVRDSAASLFFIYKIKVIRILSLIRTLSYVSFPIEPHIFYSAANMIDGFLFSNGMSAQAE